MPYLFTCEHAVNRIPSGLGHLFEGRDGILNSHRGWDPGALILARACARDCGAPLFYSSISRLVIDLNRSIHHRGIFSEFTRDMDEPEKQKVLDKFYFPYRDGVELAIREQILKPVIHLSFHSFTPEFNGTMRNGDIGLLYDPARKREKEFSLRLQSVIRKCFPDLLIRRNYPYLGIADGFTGQLRRRFPGTKYLGIEIEINQQHIISKTPVWRRIVKEFSGLLNALIDDF